MLNVDYGSWNSVLGSPLFWFNYYYKHLAPFFETVQVPPGEEEEDGYLEEAEPELLEKAGVSVDELRRFFEVYREDFEAHVDEGGDVRGMRSVLYGLEHGMKGRKEDYKELTIGFPEGYTLGITFWVYGEYVQLSHGPKGISVALGHDDPHHHLPIFRFEEILLLSRAASGVSQTFDPKYLPLLLHKFASVEEMEVASHEQFLEEQLSRAGLFEASEARMLATLIAHWRYPGAPRWWQDARLGWVNDYPHSHRNAEETWMKENSSSINSFLQACEAVVPTGPASPR